MGNIEDVMTIAIVLFVVAAALVFVVKIGHTLNTNLRMVPTLNNSAEVREVIDSSDVALNKMDYVYFGLFIGLCLGIMIGAYFVGGIPILAPIYFFVLILFGFMGIILQKVWGDISTHAQILSTTASLPIMNYIMSHLGYFTIVIGLISMVLMYVRTEDY